MSYSSDIATGFSIIRLLVSARSGQSVPVGTVGWDANRRWYEIRVLSEKERLEGVAPDQRLLLRLAREQLLRWAIEGRVPRREGAVQPWTSAFWVAVGKVLTTGVMLDPPKAMDGIDAPHEFELLYEAVVRPIQKPGVVRNRLDGALNRALGRIADHTKARMPVPAFHDASERVMRGANTSAGTVILEAVNLAGRYARRDADALVSKLMRIERALSGTPSIVLVGYASSPGGLNGEGHMREWITETVTRHVFDLNRDQARLREVAGQALRDIGSQPSLEFQARG